MSLLLHFWSSAIFFLLFAKYFFFLLTKLSRQKADYNQWAFQHFSISNVRLVVREKTKTYDLLIVLTLLLCSAVATCPPPLSLPLYVFRRQPAAYVMRTILPRATHSLCPSMHGCADQPDDDDANYKNGKWTAPNGKRNKLKRMEIVYCC